MILTEEWNDWYLSMSGHRGCHRHIKPYIWSTHVYCIQMWAWNAWDPNQSSLRAPNIFTQYVLIHIYICVHVDNTILNIIWDTIFLTTKLKYLYQTYRLQLVQIKYTIIHILKWYRYPRTWGWFYPHLRVIIYLYQRYYLQLVWHSFSLYLSKIVRNKSFPLFGCMLKHTMCGLRVCLGVCLWSSLHSYVLNYFYLVLRIRIIFLYYNVIKKAWMGKKDMVVYVYDNVVTGPQVWYLLNMPVV